jgi:aryl-alcohol dehydrogenase-like predicted oxidoreductase
MEKRQLGHSDLWITPVGVGAWAMGGGGWQFSWGPQDDQQSIAAIRAALEAGWNWVDTAAVYGLGHSEEVVARALEGISPRPYVFTKCARIWGDDRQIGKSLKAASVRRECEQSLRRLKVDVIDLYQIHWPEPDEEVEEGWETLAQLKAEGKVRWIGVSNFSVAQMQRAQAIAPITSLQPPYSIISPEIEKELLPHCQSTGVGVIVYSPMKSGLLTGKMTRGRIAAFAPDDFRRNALGFNEPNLTRNLAIQDKCVEIGARYGRSAGEVAIAWTLRNPAVTGAIVGLRSAEQFQGVRDALTFRLAPQDIAELEGFRNQQ